MYSKIKTFFELWHRSGVRSAIRSLLIYYNFLNVVRFREPRLRLSCDILHPQLPSSTSIPHPVGITIPNRAEIGDNVSIHQNVTLGIKDGGSPTICDGADIYSGAVILGDVRVGEEAVVGANAVVLDDVPDGSTVAGVPATEIQK